MLALIPMLTPGASTPPDRTHACQLQREARLDDFPVEATSALRPLGIGEMLDRAVSISVRFFVVLLTIYVVFAIPLTVLQYFGTADMAKFLSVFTDVLQKGGQHADPQAIGKALSASQVFNVFTVLYFVMAALVGPLPAAALGWTAAEIYVHGRVPTFAAAYREGLRCWLPLIGVNLLWIVFGLLAYVAVLFLVVIVVFSFALLSTVLKGFAVVLGAVVGGLFLLAFFALVLLALLAANISYFAIIVERAGFISAFSSGLTRVFGRSLRRSLLVSLALFAVGIGVYLMGALGQAVLLGLLHSNVLSTAFGAILRLVVVIFTAVFIAIYYFDIRIRTEGFDLGIAASAGETVDLPAG
jgi:hypothetical protein